MKLLSFASGTGLLLAASVMAPASTAWAAQSSAYAISADLTTDGGSHVLLAPQLPTSGSTTLGQSYDNPKSASLISKTVRLLPAVLPSPALTVLEQTVATDASGASGVDAVNTKGTSGAATGVVALMLYPPIPVPIQPVASDAVLPRPQPALLVQFSKLKASASYNQVFPGPSQRSGSTHAGSITLSGGLLGLKSLTFSGDIAPNTVAVNTPHLKITLNAQTIPKNPVCDPGTVCPLYRVLETVDTKAILIELTNAPVWGHQVSGDIAIADAQAGQ
ncbi:MAG: hypothetical protein EKK47_22320 [Burkholderiales bacterium]|jgi:hypothetical protein|nr:MAG: hypothetical protein EKK47_22320 [Burkholderiales bacterium]